MKPLFVLLITFVLTLTGTQIFGGGWDYILAGRVAMAIMLLFTAIGHFKFSKGMEMMLPGFVPFKRALVLLTGVIEIVAAVGLLLPSFYTLTSELLIIFFILILPANIYAAINHVDFERGTYQGSGMNYLWFRIPLQLLFIWWVWYFGIAV